MKLSVVSLRCRGLATTKYVVAVATVGTAMSGGMLFHSLLGFAPSASLFSCGIMFVAWFSGTGPGLLATVLTILAFDYFFLPPVYSFALPLKDIPQLVLFAVAAIFVVSLCAAQRKSADELKRMRDEQRIALQQLKYINKRLLREIAERKLAEDRAGLAEAALRPAACSTSG